MDAEEATLSTPHRGRSRYPSHLAKDAGRVPLHRRGTSRTYERLEDLLREAGYKETRVFTPEAERTENERVDGDDGGEREGFKGVSAAVVNFISGLVHGDPKAKIQHGDVLKEVHQPHTISLNDDIDSWVDGSPCPSPRMTFRGLHPPTLVVTPGPEASGSEPEHETRHIRPMASAPHFARSKLSLLTPPAQDSPPPLPPNWKEAVAEAVLRTDPGFGAQPSYPRVPPRLSQMRTQSQRSLHRHLANHRPRSSAPPRKQAFADATNKLMPPRSMRSCTSGGVVTMATVVVRSAPSSRSSSRIRGRDDTVPSLGVTMLEGENWTTPALPHCHHQAFPVCDDLSSDEEDDPVDLARILIPAKRQKSIRSLRKHLRPNDIMRPATAVGFVSSSSAVRCQRVDSTDSFEASLRRDRQRSRSGSIEDGQEWATMLGIDQPGTGKKRQPLPWSKWSLGGSNS